MKIYWQFFFLRPIFFKIRILNTAFLTIHFVKKFQNFEICFVEMPYHYLIWNIHLFLIKLDKIFIKIPSKLFFNEQNPNLTFNFTFPTSGGNWNLIIFLGWSVSDHENEICCRGHLGDKTWKKWKNSIFFALHPCTPLNTSIVHWVQHMHK